MYNREEASRQNNELARDAIESQIREALHQGPAFAKEIGQRIGQPPNVVVGLLHEMVDDEEISFLWTRGYKL